MSRGPKDLKSQRPIMNDQPPHPSELLEFSSFSFHHVEDLRQVHVPATGSDRVGKGKATEFITGQENGSIQRMELDSCSFPSLARAARIANQAEHRMTFREGLHIYPKAIGWAIGISFAIIMEGYDTALITSFYAFDEFQKQYGIPDGSGQFQISPKWQSSLSNGAVVGSIVGLFANGILTERFGYKYTMAGALLLLTFFLFLPFFAFNIQTLLAGQILCGIPWGVFSTLTTTYAAEVMPLNLRGYLTSNINLCWLLGQLCALGILRGLEAVRSTWSFRIPFGLQWVWIFIILTTTCLAPESPWWLIRRSQKDEAKKVLLRLARGMSDWDANNTIAMMEHTERVEDFADRNNNGTRPDRFSDRSYVACFRGSNRRRTEIACMIFMTQNMCGLPILGYAPYLYKQIGFDQRRSFDITLGMQGLAILGAFVSLVLLKYIGKRRKLYLIGLAFCFSILATAGAVSCVPESRTSLWVMAGLIMAFIFVFDATIGPLTYCLVAELPSNRLRVKTVVLARVAYNINSMITNVLIQRMLNPLAWNWRGRACFFCAALNAICFVYCYFRLPETRGLNFHELDILFDKGADARKFATFQAILENNGYYSLTEGRNSTRT